MQIVISNSIIQLHQIILYSVVFQTILKFEMQMPIFFITQGGLSEKFRIAQACSYLFSNAITISGNLQSPHISLLSGSSNMVDGKVGILGISHSNFSSYLYSLNNSILGTSINTIDGKVGNILSVSIPQFLTRNENVLQSSFTSSS